MCGIIGYIGNKRAIPILINGLKKLEYRGYDSAGIAVCCEGRIEVTKTKGRLSLLEKKLENVNLDCRIGIGHTRWATHGEPNDINSHPHLSNSGKIAVVHNGIIENYINLRNFLKSKGNIFISDTDTEIVAHLVEYHYHGDIKSAVMEALKQLEGSYALGVLCNDSPDTIIAARKGSPLICGIGESENFIASDIPAILNHTRDIYILEDGEVAEIRKDSISITDIYGLKAEKKVFHVDWDIEAAEKGGFEHFMIKEISEEPKAIRNAIFPRITDNCIKLDKVNIDADYLNNLDKILILACGTAYHSGVVAKYIFEKLAGISTEVDVASEFRYRDPVITDKTLAIIISQSGETLDTLLALREARKRGARILSIVNVVDSSIARESEDVMYTWAGPEIAVASTKAYNTQLSVLILIALDFARKLGKIDSQTYGSLLEEMRCLPDSVEKVVSNRESIQRFASEHFNANSIFYIGRGIDYALSMEGSLKLKEISYIHSEAYAGGELKHGTIALIEQGTLVVCSLTQDNLIEKMIGNIREVKARGATVMAVTQEKNTQVNEIADMVINIPDVHPLLAPIVAVTSMQLFAYYMAVYKGCDVDKPRNLAKSVTVE